MRIWMAIWVGSSLISRSLAAWIAGGVALRLFCVAGVASFIKGLPWTTSIAYALAAGWLVTAVIRGLRAPDPSAAPSVEDAVADEAAEPDGDPAAPPSLTVDELAIALHAIAAPHAHLSALADRLQTAPERVREGLTLAAIPITGGVRMRGRGVSTGVKADHFPPLPSPAEPPPEDVVAADQPSNNNTKRDPIVVSRWGMSIIHPRKTGDT
ncbi:hypothetical protein ACWGH2_16315 [Streptomyces sp. NPDC054871]